MPEFVLLKDAMNGFFMHLYTNTLGYILQLVFGTLQSVKMIIPYTYTLLEEFGHMGVLKDVRQRNTMYPDEPQIPIYSCILELKKEYTDSPLRFRPDGHGISQRKSWAVFKSLMEALERFSQGCYLNNELLFGTLHELTRPTVNPNLFSTKNISDVTLGWTEATHINTGEKCFMPAQFFFLTYKREKEPLLVDMNTSGGAAGTDHASTLLRAIYELVERDAFMCMYLTKSTVPKIKLDSIKNKEFQKLIHYLSRYNLEPMIFNLTNDIQISTFLAILIDHTGIGPAIILGLKSSLSSEKALFGALEEAMLGRSGSVRSYFWQKKEDVQIDHPEKIATIIQRALFWYPLSMMKHLQFLMNTPEIPLKPAYFSKKPPEELTRVLSILRNENIDVYYKDLTLQNFKKKGFLVYKAVTPHLQHLYLHEQSKTINEKRLKKVAHYFGQKKYRLNTIPHPFL